MTVVFRPLRGFGTVTFPRRPSSSYGLLVTDVGIAWPGLEYMYLAVKDNAEQQMAAVTKLQEYAHSRGLYQYGPRDPDGGWGPRTEAAFRGLLPGASGPTTARMLGGLMALSSAAFGKYSTIFGIAVARDNWLRRTQNDQQVETDLSAQNEQGTLDQGPAAWDPTTPRSDDVVVHTTDTLAAEEGANPSADVEAVVDDNVATGSQVQPRRAYVGMAVGGLVVALAVGAVVVALRSKPRRTPRRTRRR